MREKEKCLHTDCEIEDYELSIPTELVVYEKCNLCGKKIKTVYELIEIKREEI